jgi:transketolase C-terminal domain/subunit
MNLVITRVINMHTLKPLDEAAVTAEEHQIGARQRSTASKELLRQAHPDRRHWRARSFGDKRSGTD